jgi:hypothetical protein
MASTEAESIRREYPGKSDKEIAEALATSYGYMAILRYITSGQENFAKCDTEAEIRGYLTSPYCHCVEVLYDRRSISFQLNAAHVLNGRCESCGKNATRESLQIDAGNDFYFCPKCGLLFCEVCYSRLPLTGSPGYGACTRCKVKVKRTLSSFFVYQPQAVEQSQIAPPLAAQPRVSLPASTSLVDNAQIATGPVGRVADDRTPQVAVHTAKAGTRPSFWKRLFSTGSRPLAGAQPSSPAPAATPPAGGSKADLISMIAKMQTFETAAAAKAIVASNRFGIDVVKELVIETFFDKLPYGINVAPITVRSVSMEVGDAMGGSSFANWLGKNIVVGREPAQMIDNPCKYGSFGMWQDAKELCEKHGMRFR